MKIAVVGCGAMGSIYAALLADAAEVSGGDDADQLFREALSRLGMHRLTTDARRILGAAFAVDGKRQA